MMQVWWTKLDYLEAEAVLRREHKIRLDYIEKNGDKNLWQFGFVGNRTSDGSMDGV